MRALATPYHRSVMAIAAHVSISGLLYGLDTGSIGPITEMAQFRSSIGHLTSTQQGVYVACILLSAAMSSLLSGHIADAISRRYGILTGGVICVVGTAMSATAPSFAVLIVARVINGIGFGQGIAVTTVYLVELAPKEIRGVTVCLLQLYMVVGITMGYFIALGTQGIQSSFAWRVPFIVQACLAAVLTVGMAFMPFSPRWLMHKQRPLEARAVLAQYREAGAVDAELLEIKDSLEEHQGKEHVGFLEMFQKRYVGRTALGIFIMAFQQLTGIDAVLYFAPILFRQAGFTTAKSSFLASGVCGLIMLLSTIPAQIWIDYWGRRKPLIYGGAAMTSCFFVIGSLYALFGTRTQSGVLLESEAAKWVVVVLTYIFVANFSWSWGVVGKIYACEIIPTHLRARVVAVELLANWLVNFAVALTAPLFLRSSLSGPYFLYGSATLLAVCVCVLMPETKGRTLEEIENAFEQKHIVPESSREPTEERQTV